MQPQGKMSFSAWAVNGWGRDRRGDGDWTCKVLHCIAAVKA